MTSQKQWHYYKHARTETQHCPSSPGSCPIAGIFNVAVAFAFGVSVCLAGALALELLAPGVYFFAVPCGVAFACAVAFAFAFAAPDVPADVTAQSHTITITITNNDEHYNLHQANTNSHRCLASYHRWLARA